MDNEQLVLEELREKIRNFTRTYKHPPALSTLRMWTNYKVPRPVLRRLLEENIPNVVGGETALQESGSEPNLDSPSIDLPAPRARDISQWPQIAVPALVFSDLHIPSLHNRWMKHIVSEALKRNIRRAVIVGDLLDFVHLSKFPNSARWKAEDELEDLAQVLRWLSQYMTEIHIMPGNHDDRFANRLERQLSTAWLLRNVVNKINSQVLVYEHHHAYLGNRWLVAHPRTYSRSPAQPSLELAKAHNRNVAVGHTHHFNISRYYGRWAVEIGMVADAARLEYKQIELTTHPSSELGALIVLADERPVFLHPDLG